MGLTARVRHYWSKVDPQQFYELDKYGDLQTPSVVKNNNVNQNFNFMSVDMVYTWQFAQGSFINVVWKNIDRNFNRYYEQNYFANLGKTISGNGYNNDTQFSSFSIKVIYFLDYLTMKNRVNNKKQQS